MSYPTYVEAVAAYNKALDNEEKARHSNKGVRKAELATQEARKVRDQAARMRQ